MLAPAVAVLPAALVRLAGAELGGIGQYMACAVAAGLPLVLMVAGARLPGMRELPLSERLARLAAPTVAALIAGASLLAGRGILAFSAVGVASVHAATAAQKQRQPLALEALPYLAAVAYGFALLLAFTPLADAGSHLWRAGGAAWLALLGSVTVSELLGRLPVRWRPLLGAAGAGVFAAVAARYFGTLAGRNLPAATYAVGLAANAVFWAAAALLGAAGASAAVAAALLGNAWHAVGGWPYSVPFFLGALVAGMLRRAGDRRLFGSGNEAVVLLAPGALLAALGFFFPSAQVCWRMASASLAAVFGMIVVQTGSAIWGKQSYRLFPPLRARHATEGAFTAPALITGLLLVAAMAFAPWFAGGAGFGWALLAALAAAIGIFTELFYTGAGVRLPGGIGAALVSPLAAWLLYAGFERLFPRG